MSEKAEISADAGGIGRANKGNYRRWAKRHLPRTRHAASMLRAFVVGGAICCIAQLIADMFTAFVANASVDEVKAYTTVTVIAVTGILTGFGVYDRVGSFGGAGSIVPITGFANSVVAAAMEHNREGIILGLSANMFKLAGPVIVFGVVSSVLVGVFTMIFGGM